MKSTSGELRTEDIETEVFFFPAATHVEKAGSFTQTQRLVQWRHKAVEPPGDCQTRATCSSSSSRATGSGRGWPVRPMSVTGRCLI
jgi:anaerobic selenocysteine-containing dehydrogenase